MYSLGASDLLGNNLHTLPVFISEVAKEYKDNRFHNFRHAVAVLHSTFKLITMASGNHYDGLRLFGPSTLPLFVQFTLLVSALVHDIGHPGNTNDFEIKSNSDIARLYNKVSVLENHHISVTLDLLSRPNCNFLAYIEADKRKMFEKILRGFLL